MSESRPLISLTIGKDFLERLKPIICCSESLQSCRDDEFCASNPADWPVISNGHDTEMTRLVYPGSDEKPSVPGITALSDAYLSWYSTSGCGTLASDIADLLPHAECHLHEVDAEKIIAQSLPLTARKRYRTAMKAFSKNISTSIEPMQSHCQNLEQNILAVHQSMQHSCNIMYECDEANTCTFDRKRAQDLADLSLLCEKVKEEEKKKYPWWSFGTGGGFGFGLGLIVWIIVKVIKAISTAGNHARAAGRGAENFDQGISTFSRATRNFFGRTLPSLGRTLKYVFTLGWLRGQQPPKDPELEEAAQNAALPTTNPSSSTTILIRPGRSSSDTQMAAFRPTDEDIHNTLASINPRANVAFKQLAKLIHSDRYERRGERFIALPHLVQRYMSFFAVEQWKKQAPLDQYVMVIDDERPTEGKLPFGFIERFSEKYLKNEDMFDLLAESTKVWAAEYVIAPDPVTVQDQLAQNIFGKSLYEIETRAHTSAQTDARTNTGKWVTPKTIEYAADKIIHLWSTLEVDDRQAFVDVAEEMADGALPFEFIRLFRRSRLRQLKDVEQRALVYHRLRERHSLLTQAPFHIVDARAERLLAIWQGISSELKSAFWKRNGKPSHAQHHRGIPDSFIDFLQTALGVGTDARLPLEASQTPWTNRDGHVDRHQGYDVARAMHQLTQLNSPLAYYPPILRQRAITAINAWLLLEDPIRATFFEVKRNGENAEDLAMGMLPFSFIALMNQVTQEVGTQPRPPLFDGDPPRNGGGGNGSNGAPPTGSSEPSPNGAPPVTNGGTQARTWAQPFIAREPLVVEQVTTDAAVEAWVAGSDSAMILHEPMPIEASAMPEGVMDGMLPFVTGGAAMMGAYAF